VEPGVRLPGQSRLRARCRPGRAFDSTVRRCRVDVLQQSALLESVHGVPKGIFYFLSDHSCDLRLRPVTFDDGTDSASADFTLYVIKRADGWIVWGSYLRRQVDRERSCVGWGRGGADLTAAQPVGVMREPIIVRIGPFRPK
jgi:hypothetical protein